MMESLLPLFEAAEATLVGQVVRKSLWLFPVIESIHLVGLAVLGGTVLALDLRLLNFFFKDQSTEHVARTLRPYFLASLITLLITGVLLFFSESVKLYYNQPFWIKMGALLGGMVFAGTVRRKVAWAEPGHFSPVVQKIVAVVNIVLWSTVAWGGRWIGFWG